MYENLEEPYVSDELVDYLNKQFNIQYCLSRTKDLKDSSEALGFMKGVREVVDHLSSLSESNKKGDY